MQRHLTVIQLCRFAGSHKQMSEDEKYKLVDELAQRHAHGLQFGKPPMLVAPPFHSPVDQFRQTNGDTDLTKLWAVPMCFG